VLHSCWCIVFGCLDSNPGLNSNVFVCFKKKKKEDNAAQTPCSSPAAHLSFLALSPVHEVRSRPLILSPRPRAICCNPAQQAPVAQPAHSPRAPATSLSRAGPMRHLPPRVAARTTTESGSHPRRAGLGVRAVSPGPADPHALGLSPIKPPPPQLRIPPSPNPSWTAPQPSVAKPPPPTRVVVALPPPWGSPGASSQGKEPPGTAGLDSPCRVRVARARRRRPSAPPRSPLPPSPARLRRYPGSAPCDASYSPVLSPLKIVLPSRSLDPLAGAPRHLLCRRPLPRRWPPA
jgi:hypothetical protein